MITSEINSGISSNLSGGSGGGIATYRANPTLEHLFIYKNEALVNNDSLSTIGGGGGIAVLGNHAHEKDDIPDLRFLTIVSNKIPKYLSDAYGSGIFSYIRKDFEIKNSGIRQTKVRYNAPIVVNFVKIFSIYIAVLSPGLIPGINPPYFLKLSAVSVGLNVIEV